MRRTVATILAVATLTAVAATGLPVGPAAAATPVADRTTGHSGSGHGAAAPTHRNPVALSLPDGETAASCADPTAIRGVGRDRNWYLYCTTDALTATEQNADGSLVQHGVPTYRSTDLTHWTYVNDAFPTRPAWVGSANGIWAPDVVYRAGDRGRAGTWYLYYAASDTPSASAPTGGGSAVGVATSSSPTGPWKDSGGPVVAPQTAANGTGARWAFDPEVITDKGTTYLYFGSYFGGVNVRTLSADGLRSDPASERQIAIDNRYEGAYLMRHDGWWYFTGSATNCCNGALTGYGVFVARSRSPLGPFTDQDGVAITSTRVGGTPLLAQNGNRWVGTGHNTVVTDLAGQDWIIYHAVDRGDPYYAGQPTYTKRPALIDPLDWRHGWPVVRGGAGPSDTVQPGPVAQPGQRATYRATTAPVDVPGRTIRALSTSFDGTTLPTALRWTREPDRSTWTVGGGAFRWQTQDADIHPPATPLASVLSEPAPRGDYVLQTTVAVDTPATGDGVNYVQGGLIVWGDDGDYVRLTSNSIFNTRQTEFGKQVSGQPAGAPSYGNTVVGPVGDTTTLRIVHRVVDGEHRYTASTSVDGRHFVRGGTWTADLGSAPRIGLISLGGAGFTSTFEDLRVSTVATHRR
ncbi:MULTISPECIES: family 43 glycosylhydrolase [unclassified Curtobacterium]|uniref:family 43 glycosylhydrolase n=1 Tax=unclassified Curtobacterium TaxID=257496 RepID=UPI00104E5DB5|nr:MULTISPECIES: family 43 glycosylhydrolase [unclassified Curtobacterium]TCL71727.1 arabinan endo-1,5-alpha-L-arabinosidase [Curtobacterium sp. PhB128]TCL90243.1 arabinan endo-1,5-alpha-L-arabinosidase [Curtobacterium sp. PhB138]